MPNMGMLWFDNDPKMDLQGKIKRAAEYYRNKYGQTPNLCFVHPCMLTPEYGSETRMAGLMIRLNNAVRPNHFWIGIEAKTPEK
jgi:hypothetical protein